MGRGYACSRDKLLRSIRRSPSEVDYCPPIVEAQFLVDANRWDEKAGLQRDALSSQLSTRLKRGRQGDRR